MKNPKTNKAKETQNIEYKWVTQSEKIFPSDHLQFRTIEFAIGSILVILFISFKTFNMLRFSPGKIRLMMTDKEKEFQS